MSDQQHTQEGQVQRAKRLRAQIERLKSSWPGPGQSLQEQIEQCANKSRAHEAGERDEAQQP